jgi:hypothetical protein
MERRKPNPQQPKPKGYGVWSHGGPAKGEGQHGPGPRPGRPKKGSNREREIQARREKIYAEKVATIGQCYLMLTQIMFYSPQPSVQLQAAQALLVRLEGTPVQKHLNVDYDHVSQLTDEQLASELRRLDEKLRHSRPDDKSDGDEIPEPVNRTIQ